MQTSVEARIEAVRTQVSTAMTSLRSDVATEIGRSHRVWTRCPSRAPPPARPCASLRSELTVPSSELRDRLVATTGESVERCARDGRHPQRASRRSRAHCARTCWPGIEEQYARRRAAGRFAADVTGTTGAARESSERLAALAAVSDEVRRTLDELRSTVDTATGRCGRTCWPVRTSSSSGSASASRPSGRPSTSAWRPWRRPSARATPRSRRP
jgi:hypothetical protein